MSRKRALLALAGLALAALALAAVAIPATAPPATALPATALPAAAPPTAAAPLLAEAPAPPASPPRRGVWFCGDFESGDFTGWDWDIGRQENAVLVTRPVRRGRYAARITLAPGDHAANKPRAELKLADKEIERAHGGQGSDIWYGWSLLVPADYADPPEGAFQIVGQWHHRATVTEPGNRAEVKGPPPLAVYLEPGDAADPANSGHPADSGHPGNPGRPGDPGGRGAELVLIAHSSAEAEARTLAASPIQRGAWSDLVFHLHCSTGRDGYVEAWLNGRPFTAGKIYGPTLYSAVSNYLRLGLYRSKGVRTTNQVYYDEVRVGDSYQAVAP